ncbi:MAG: general secretion pathway protein GspK [Candidatus Hydrogenedentes bacterium]|nr:general secretion pathway protein GspK [Candidatus Hydrogenedentota bacterium]
MPGNVSGFCASCRESGIALVFVITVCLGLVTVVLLFASAVAMESRGAGNAHAGAQAEQIVEGALRYVAFILENSEDPGTSPDLDTYEQEAVEVGEGRFWLLGRDPGALHPRTPYYGLVDEASKMNINTASQDMLEYLPQMTSELAAAIVDWRDSDSDLTTGGAESANYLLLDPPYQCKNAEFETTAELRLVMGMTVEILYGEDTNQNHILDSNEDDGDTNPPSDDRDGLLDAGLLPFVTVYSAEPNTTADGQARVNINESDSAQVQQALEEELGDRAQVIAQALGQGSRREWTSLLELFTEVDVTLEEAASIEDALTVSDDDSARGLINVNTAPEEVLTCVPGIGTESAQELVSYRTGKTEDELASVAWVKEVLDKEAAVQAGPYLTVRSYQFTADITAVGKNGRGFRRTAFVLDTSGGEAVVVYRRDLCREGWPLGESARTASEERS